LAGGGLFGGFGVFGFGRRFFRNFRWDNGSIVSRTWILKGAQTIKASRRQVNGTPVFFREVAGNVASTVGRVVLNAPLTTPRVLQARGGLRTAPPYLLVRTRLANPPFQNELDFYRAATESLRHERCRIFSPNASLTKP
jgi:hypothetical protein